MWSRVGTMVLLRLCARISSAGRLSLCGVHRQLATSARVHNESQIPSNDRRARSRSEYQAKYAARLRERIQSEGVGSLEELKIKLDKDRGGPLKLDAVMDPLSISSKRTSEPGSKHHYAPPVRKDSSPVKPLSLFFNLSRLLATPHTTAQVDALWTAYHASRSNGTGRGFLSASLSRDVYLAMMEKARKYKLFVLPLPRQGDGTEASGGTEFFVMEWSFHEPPPYPSSSEPDMFQGVKPPSEPKEMLPPIATVIFTPLQEYKLRQSFAQPYLILTFYTDLASTHGMVMLHGEITPSSNGSSSYLLSQVDAQLLALGLQKFYVPRTEDGDDEAERLLRTFHEEGEKFDWQKLMQVASLGVGL